MVGLPKERVGPVCRLDDRRVVGQVVAHRYVHGASGTEAEHESRRIRPVVRPGFDVDAVGEHMADVRDRDATLVHLQDRVNLETDSRHGSAGPFIEQLVPQDREPNPSIR